MFFGFRHRSFLMSLFVSILGHGSAPPSGTLEPSKTLHGRLGHARGPSWNAPATLGGRPRVPRRGGPGRCPWGPEPVFGQVASEVPFWTVLGAIQESFLDEYKAPFAVHFWTSLVPLWNVLETIQESFLDELEAPFAVDS